MTCEPRAQSGSRDAPQPPQGAGLRRVRHGRRLALERRARVRQLPRCDRAGLPWDALLGAEVTRAYKPAPRAYLGTAEVLGLPPGEVCLVAAHHRDLAAARACGLRTAYIHRPAEYGGRPAPDAHAAQAWDWSADSLTGLAAQLRC